MHVTFRVSQFAFLFTFLPILYTGNWEKALLLLLTATHTHHLLCLHQSKLLHCFISYIIYCACHHSDCNLDFLVLYINLTGCIAQRLPNHNHSWALLAESARGCSHLLTWEPWHPSFLLQLHLLSPTHSARQLDFCSTACFPDFFLSFFLSFSIPPPLLR